MRTCHNKVEQRFKVVGSPQTPSLAQTQALSARAKGKAGQFSQTPGRGASLERSLQNPRLVMGWDAMSRGEIRAVLFIYRQACRCAPGLHDP
jgi:hypothetical protein